MDVDADFVLVRPEGSTPVLDEPFGGHLVADFAREVLRNEDVEFTVPSAVLPATRLEGVLREAADTGDVLMAVYARRPPQIESPSARGLSLALERAGLEHHVSFDLVGTIAASASLGAPAAAAAPIELSYEELTEALEQLLREAGREQRPLLAIFDPPASGGLPGEDVRAPGWDYGFPVRISQGSKKPPKPPPGSTDREAPPRAPSDRAVEGGAYLWRIQ